MKLVSIVMPVYNTPPDVLDKTILSCLNQTHKNFELWTKCLSQGIKIRNMKDCLLDYNFHGTNVSIVDANTREWNNSMEEYKKRLI